MLDYILCSRLCKGEVTVFQPSIARTQGFFVFTAEGVEFIPAQTTGQSQAWAHDRKVWALIDEFPLPEFADAAGYSIFFLWACSPAKHPASTWPKEVDADVWYMDSLSWPYVYAPRYVSIPPTSSVAV